MGAQHVGIMAPAKAQRGGWLLSPCGTLITAIVALVTLACLLGGGDLAPLRSAATATQLWWHSRAGGPPATRSPALHGPVKKRSMVNMTHFYPPLAKPCKAERLWWYDVAVGRGTPTQADLARLRRGPCMQCQVYVNHLYKMIYVRHAKVASSTVLDYFGLCTDETKGCLHNWEADMTSLVTTPEVKARPTFKQLSHLSQDQVASIWGSYFVFTTVRDPLDRAVSQYNFLLRSNLAEPPGCSEAAKALDWDSFCDSPPSLAVFCARRPDCCKQAEGVYDGIGWKLAHIVPQAQCLADASGLLAVDFVAWQEHLAEDLAAVLGKLNARRDEGVPPLVPARPLGTEKMRNKCALGGSVRTERHSTAPMRDATTTWQGLVAKEQYCTTEEYYSGRHAHCRASIEAYFADDLRLLYGGSAGGAGG